MQRRDFILAAGTVAAGAALTACGKPASETSGTEPAVVRAKPIEWKMVTTWPKNFPGLGTGAETLARVIGEMSGGRLRVKVYGANELVPAFEAFDAVAQGSAQLGHAGAYYWKGKAPAAQFFSAVPFGLTAQEMNGWLYHGGGMALWEQVYAPFGLLPLAAGNTGTQMAGWFNRTIDSVADLKGLKMRIPGLGGEVLRRAGGTPVSMPGGELFTSLQSGAIDATEWVGPYNDLAFGLYKVAKYYYYPGWHEPGTTLECFVNRAAFNGLPEDLRHIVVNAAKIVNQDMLAEYATRNNDALTRLIEVHGVTLRRLPDDVIAHLKQLSGEVVAEVANKDPLARQVYDSFIAFRAKAIAWSAISEQAYLNARSAP